MQAPFFGACLSAWLILSPTKGPERHLLPPSLLMFSLLRLHDATSIPVAGSRASLPILTGLDIFAALSNINVAHILHTIDLQWRTCGIAGSGPVWQ